MSWNDKTKTATVTVNGITRTFSLEYYGTQDGHIVIDNKTFNSYFTGTVKSTANVTVKSSVNTTVIEGHVNATVKTTTVLTAPGAGVYQTSKTETGSVRNSYQYNQTTATKSPTPTVSATDAALLNPISPSLMPPVSANQPVDYETWLNDTQLDPNRFFTTMDPGSMMYPIGPKFTVDGNTAYAGKVGIHDANENYGYEANIYALPAYADAYAVGGQENNYNGTLGKGGTPNQVTGADIKAEAGVAVAGVDGYAYAGYKNIIGVSVSGAVNFGQVDAYSSLSARVDGENSVGIRLGAEASVVDGSVGFGIYICGYELRIGLEGAAGDASAGGELGVFNGRATARVRVGLGFGIGTWIDIGKKREIER